MQKFDWTEILPEPERSSVRKQHQHFLESFPTKEELDQAANEGRQSLKEASFRVDLGKKMMALADDLGGSFLQPSDRRARDHLLVYCPFRYSGGRLRKESVT